ncbi:hypothetical protein [Hydrogenimonas cancrithermarum]|uniref:Uncharacterized protein n=1 Tax=Hydrogenimonas cancrithermarum TaxID=2993563 RepID=A0ABN6WZZ2_9BACT|nr:hypothetical protein [Hydrogenimonas cancrithermarum]BDY13997.1 hypothetical protein HCR_23100 [Hydrogenimonas cancrithermarum]
MNPVKTIAGFLLFTNDAVLDLLCEWRRGLLAANTFESRIMLYLLHPFHVGLMRTSGFLDRYALELPRERRARK